MKYKAVMVMSGECPTYYGDTIDEALEKAAEDCWVENHIGKDGYLLNQKRIGRNTSSPTSLCSTWRTKLWRCVSGIPSSTLFQKENNYGYRIL